MFRQMKREAVLFGIVLFSLLLCFGSYGYMAQGAEAGTASAAETMKTVRVGYLEQRGYSAPIGNGILSGFDVEYTHKVAQYAGFHVEFRRYMDFRTMLEGLEAGEVQMALGISKTDERVERFLFPDNWMNRGTFNIRVRMDDVRYDYGNVQKIDGMRLGVMRGSVMYTQVKKWAERNKVLPKFSLYETTEDMEQALEIGEIDGIVAGGMMLSERYRAIMRRATAPYYMVFNRDERELCMKVDAAINRILREEPMYTEMLALKYLRDDQYNVFFSSQEERYLTEHPVLRVAVGNRFAPFFVHPKGEEPKGILPDYYRIMASRLGVRVEFKEYDNRAAALEALKRGEADVIGTATEDIIAESHTGLVQTRPYFSFHMFQLVRAGTEDVRRAAVLDVMPENVRMAIRSRFPDIYLVDFPDLESCFDALEDKRVDSMFCNVVQMNSFMSRYRPVGYRMEGVENVSVNYSGEVLPENAVLGEILSKASMSVENEVAGIIDRNVYMEPSFKGLLHSLPTSWVVGFLLLIFAVVGLSVWEHYKAEKQKSLAALAKKQAALDAAEQARRAESTFLSSMSHDIRTPLNGILGYTHLAQKTENMEEIHHFLDRINGSGHLMLDIVNDILDLSKIESGKMVLQKDWFYGKELFQAIESSISMNAEGNHIGFTARYDAPEALWVNSDRLRLQQIAMNLLSNAVKYTPAGGHVSWTVTVAEEKEQWMLTEVIRDDGIGMSDEFQAKMFEAFSQENRSEMKGVQGTGLGLSIARRFVELLGGTIAVESRLNHGTTFTLHIPVTAELRQTEEAEGTKQGTVSRDLLKGVPILLCEDNEVNAELAKFLLSDYGADRIDWAKDGKEGVEMFTKSGEGYYALVLMDLRMPVMDGFEAAKNIRALSRSDAAGIPIIAMSADAFASDIRHCMEAGMNVHISKPIDPEVLIHTIEEYLK